MNFRTNVARSIKELLGLHQWPKRPVIEPIDFEQQIYSALVQEGDVCFDIGASLGHVALYMAKLAGPSGCVFAFEPVFPVYLELCRNLQTDGFMKSTVVPIPMGISNKIGQAKISVPDGHFGFGSLAEQPKWHRSLRPEEVSTFECEFTTLDTVLYADRYSRPDFMKIDVEGAELLVLQGARSAFDNRFRPLMLIELFAPWEKAFGYGPWEVLSFLSAYGYEFLFACPTGLVEHSPSQAIPFPPEYEKGYNVIAFVSDVHAARINRARHLRVGASSAVLSMPPAPLPNRAE